ncbi:MAG: hypothetical protein EHM41_16850 [Chloroflexi bacterium]|nr:MAG: hypothetical protein EHM41_16850 [Chloroflexota bacterium]
MTDRHHSSRIFSLLIVLFLLSWSGSKLETVREKFHAVQSTPPVTEPVIMKIYYLDQDDQTDLIARYDVIEVNETGGYLIISLEPEERLELEAHGYRVEIHDDGS